MPIALSINWVLSGSIQIAKIFCVPLKNLLSRLIFDFKFFIFIYSKFEQFKKALSKVSIFVIEVKSKFEKSKIFNDSHPLNILSIFTIWEVLKFVKFIEVKLIHPLKILSNFLFFSVLKLERSIDFNNLQLQKIWPRDITFEVSKFDKFNVINE